VQLGRATYGGGRSGDGDSGLFTRVLYKSYLILLLKIGGELSAWDSVRFGSGSISERLSQVGIPQNIIK